MKKKNSNNIFILSFSYFILISIFFIGTSTPDGSSYIKAAFSVSHGNALDFENANAFSQLRYLKLAIIYPYALFYKLFGVNIISNVLLSIISGYFCIVLVYLITKILSDKKTAFLSALFAVTLPASIFFSTITLQEIVHSVLVLASFYFFLKAVKIDNKVKLNYFLSGLSLAVALYVRENSVFFGLFYVLYFLFNRDKINLSILMLPLGYLTGFLIGNGILYLQTGDFLYQLSFAGRRYGGEVYPEKNHFFENVSHPIYYLKAIILKVNYIGLVSLTTLVLVLKKLYDKTSFYRVKTILFFILTIYAVHELLFGIIFPAQNINYIIPIFPMFCILLGLLVADFGLNTKSSTMFTFILLVFSIIIFIVLLFFHQNFIDLVIKVKHGGVYLLEDITVFADMVYRNILIFLAIVILSTSSLYYLGERNAYIHKNYSRISLTLFIVLSSLLVFTPMATFQGKARTSIYNNFYKFMEEKNIKNIYIADYQQSILPELYSKYTYKLANMSEITNDPDVEFIYIDKPIKKESLKNEYLLYDPSQEIRIKENEKLVKQIVDNGEIYYQKGKLKLIKY